MDRASDYGSEGWGFESLRAHTVLRQSRKPLRKQRLSSFLQVVREARRHALSLARSARRGKRRAGFGGFGLCEVSQMSDAFGDAPADRPLWGYSEPLLRHLGTARRGCGSVYRRADSRGLGAAKLPKCRTNLATRRWMGSCGGVRNHVSDIWERCAPRGWVP